MQAILEPVSEARCIGDGEPPFLLVVHIARSWPRRSCAPCRRALRPCSTCGDDHPATPRLTDWKGRS
jgi:hypothetical protein